MINNQKKTPLFISIIPNLVGGEGHIIPYHISLTSATKILEWKHQIIYSGNEKTLTLPDNWSKCLADTNLEADANLLGNITKFKDIIKLANSLNNYLKILISKYPEQDIIIFIERFIHLQLFALYLSLVKSDIPKDKLFIWVLYRRDFHNHKTKFIYKLLNQGFKKLVKANHFHLFSDSHLLANSMSQYFEESMTVMPIPHTELINKVSNTSKNDNIICWWAGPPREEKGWQTIRQLSQCQTNLANQFTLVAAKSSQLNYTEKAMKVILTNDNLTRTEYVDWLSKSDIILLPYNAVAYEERTSGIFTESIIAGNIPVTRAKTWMARELFKFDLEELIVDWEDIEGIFEQFVYILDSEEISDKLEIMREEYRNFHNLNNFANQFKKCYET